MSYIKALRVKPFGTFSAVALAVVLFAMPSVVGTAHAASSDVDYLVSRINATRAENGVCPLTVDASRQSIAQSWAASMASAGALSHRLIPGGVAVAENVGYGPSADAVHASFLKSSGHFANIVNKRFDRVGVGVVQSGKYLWVTYEFMDSNGLAHRCATGAPAAAAPAAPSSPPTTSPRPTSPPVTAPAEQRVAAASTAPRQASRPAQPSAAAESDSSGGANQAAMVAAVAPPPAIAPPTLSPEELRQNQLFANFASRLASWIAVLVDGAVGATSA